MRSDLQFKLLATLNKKQEEKGFTLIELLVVVIIIGVLAAVALPNLLKQVGKARETELKNATGTVNRSQQSYHFERQVFANSVTLLGVTIPDEYINNTATMISATDASKATVAPENTNASNDGTRAYSGIITYDNTVGEYAQLMCQSNDTAKTLAVPADATACPEASVEVR